MKLNKKGNMTWLGITILIGIAFLLLGGLDFLDRIQEEREAPGEFPEAKYCKARLDKLSCEEITECYEYCEKEFVWITQSNSCRDSYKARLMKCYGGQ